MNKKYLFIVVFLLAGLFQISEASYSFIVMVKYPFMTDHYGEDSLGNVILVSDSLAGFIPIKAIIFKTEIDSLYQESVTND
uniref:Uncharacterized protein n=1 Tax=candidate division WOR-3 bacterium TaxID=2052148 RepID=A0A7V1EIN2_UNCW3